MTMKKNSGFTLVELMVAVAVAGIILTVGLPQMSVFFKGNRMVTNANDLLAGLHIARSEAIKRNSKVTICKSSSAGSATPVCLTNTDTQDWEDGWFVFVDTGDVIGEYESTKDGAILRVNTGAEGDKVTITASNSDIGQFVTFSSRGVPTLNGSSVSGVFKVCDQRGLGNARGVLLGASGRVRVTKEATRIVACP